MKITKKLLKQLIKEEISAMQEQDMEYDFDSMSREVHKEVAIIVSNMMQALDRYDPDEDSVEDLGAVLGLAERISLLYDIYFDDSGKLTMQNYQDKYGREPLGHTGSRYN